MIRVTGYILSSVTVLGLMLLWLWTVAESCANVFCEYCNYETHTVNYMSLSSMTLVVSNVTAVVSTVMYKNKSLSYNILLTIH